MTGLQGHAANRTTKQSPPLTLLIHLLSLCLQVQKKQSTANEDEVGGTAETPLRDTDSQYGTWETGLRTDDRYHTPQTVAPELLETPNTSIKCFQTMLSVISVITRMFVCIFFFPSIWFDLVS